jgi:excisionase family DNA binding protein
MTKRTRRRAVVRIEQRSVPTLVGWCQVCQCDVPTLSPGDAAGLLQVPEETIQRLVAEGVIHAIGVVTGTRVCQPSLFVGRALGGKPE